MLRRLLAAAAAALVTGVLLTPGMAFSSAGGSTVRLHVMTLNIFYGGDDLDLSTDGFCAVPDGCPQTLTQIERLIRKARADVVGLQETERNTERIAADLGWYGSNRAHVMSRFPIIDPPDSNGRYVFLQVAPGRVVAMADTHLPSDPYGPYLVRDGGTLAQVLDLERSVRLPAVRPLTTVLPELAHRGIPVFLTGDFNSPSHLDWTPAVAEARPDVPYPVRWPASAALAAAGLTDTFREAHPDPVAVPGFTWTPGGPESDPHEVFDRIDWVLRAGPSRTVASEVVYADTTFYPTDHRGVVSTVDVRPAPMPVLVAPATRNVTIGQPLPVVFHAPSGRPARVVLVDARGRTVATGARLRTAGLTRGRYTVQLRSGRSVLSSAPVWLYPPGTKPQVSTDRTAYRTSSPIGVDFSDAPGMGLDWISVFRCAPAGCDPNTGYLVYAYTGTAIEGHLTIGPDAVEGNESWPLPAGRYVVRLLPDDGLRSVAESKPFVIR